RPACVSELASVATVLTHPTCWAIIPQMRNFNVLLVACALMSVLVIQAQDDPLAKGKADPMAILVNNACAACHNLDRVKNKKADADGWRTTVTRMQGKGAEVTDEQVPLLVDYLVKNADTLPVAAGKAKATGAPRGLANGGGGNNAKSYGKNLKVLEG